MVACWGVVPSCPLRLSWQFCVLAYSCQAYASKRANPSQWEKEAKGSGLWSLAARKGSDRSGYLGFHGFHAAWMDQNPQLTAPVPVLPRTAEQCCRKAWPRKPPHGRLCSPRHSYRLATWYNVEVSFVEQMLYCGLLRSKQTLREGWWASAFWKREIKR